jgi:hypothetical protein
MRWISFMAICALGASTDGAPGVSPGKGFELIACGILPAEMVTWSSGEIWWGVFASGNGFALQPATLSVTPCRDIYDESDELTGKKTAVEGEQQPLFLVKALKNPVAGPMLTVFRGTLSLLPGREVSFGIGGRQNLQLQTKGTQVPLEEANNRFGDIVNYELTVTGGKDNVVPQVLVRTDAVWSDGIPRLHWVGDLDRDGLLDFLLDTSMHYAAANTQLYLSSEAGDTDVAAPVATMPSSGC